MVSGWIALFNTKNMMCFWVDSLVQLWGRLGRCFTLCSQSYTLISERESRSRQKSPVHIWLSCPLSKVNMFGMHTNSEVYVHNLFLKSTMSSHKHDCIHAQTHWLLHSECKQNTCKKCISVKMTSTMPKCMATKQKLSFKKAKLWHINSESL